MARESAREVCSKLSPEDIVGGSRGEWYAQLPLETQSVGMGMFYRKRDALKAARNLLARARGGEYG